MDQRDHSIKRMNGHLLNCSQTISSITQEERELIVKQIVNSNSQKSRKRKCIDRTLFDLFPFKTPTETNKETLNEL